MILICNVYRSLIDPIPRDVNKLFFSYTYLSRAFPWTFKGKRYSYFFIAMTHKAVM